MIKCFYREIIKEKSIKYFDMENLNLLNNEVINKCLLYKTFLSGVAVII